MAKIPILPVRGLYFHISAPINMNFCTGERACGPFPQAKFHVYRGNMSPLRGEKRIFGPLSKNNTGMAALSAGLPVIISHFSVLVGARPTIPTILGMVIEEVRTIFAPPNFIFI